MAVGRSSSRSASAVAVGSLAKRPSAQASPARLGSIAVPHRLGLGRCGWGPRWSPSQSQNPRPGQASNRAVRRNQNYTRRPTCPVSIRVLWPLRRPILPRLSTNARPVLATRVRRCLCPLAPVIGVHRTPNWCPMDDCRTTSRQPIFRSRPPMDRRIAKERGSTVGSVLTLQVRFRDRKRPCAPVGSFGRASPDGPFHP